MRELDAEIRTLYAQRRPITRALRLQADAGLADRLRHIDDQIDERELEYERLGRRGA
jgi:hypothetical protein